MPVQTIHALGESQITLSGGAQLSGITQGDGSHLVTDPATTLTLNANAWEAILVDDDDTSFDDNDGGQRLEGAQTFDGTSYADNLAVEAEYQFVVEDPAGNQYTLYAFNIVSSDGLPSYGSVEGLAFFESPGVTEFPPVGVELTIISASEGPNDVLYEELATPPCFTPGTLIRTPQGEVDIDDLSVGDMVSTLDHGPQTIRWIGRTTFAANVLQAQPRFRPITVAQDAFGAGYPSRDMQVSPQHRIFCAGWRAQLHFADDELLVAAAKLQNDQTIRRENVAKSVTYIHLLFDQHEVVWSNGLLSESYYPGENDQSDMAREVAAFFPDRFGKTAPRKLARPCIVDRTAITLVA